VVYAGTPRGARRRGDQKAKILSALDRLEAAARPTAAPASRGVFARAAGFIKNGINRAARHRRRLQRRHGGLRAAEEPDRDKRKSVWRCPRSLRTGNYNDRLMEQLADAGNGNYTYVDSLEEATARWCSRAPPRCRPSPRT